MRMFCCNFNNSILIPWGCFDNGSFTLFYFIWPINRSRDGNRMEMFRERWSEKNLDILISSEGRWEGWLIFECGFSVGKVRANRTCPVGCCGSKQNVSLSPSVPPAQGTSSTTARTSTPRSTTGWSSPWWGTGSHTRSRSSPWTLPTSSRSRPATPRAWGPCLRPCSSAPPKVPGPAAPGLSPFPWPWDGLQWIPGAAAQLLRCSTGPGGSLFLLLQTQGGCSESAAPVGHTCSGDGMVHWELVGCNRPLSQELMMVMGK